MSPLPPDSTRGPLAVPSDRRRKHTMPPPELADRTAPASVGQLVLEATRHDSPVSRHGGPRAEQGFLRTLLSDRTAAGDTAGEREASIALARLLESRGLDLDMAASLARRALALGDDPVLRGELASWLAGLGEPALAAATLRGLCDPSRPFETARTLIKIAVLMARAGDPAGAADALTEAASLDPKDALAVELLGTLAAWAPADVPPHAAAAAYLAAATRREAAKDKEAAFEDLLRAVEIAPDHDLSASTLATALAARARPAAADELLRLHGRALANTAPDRAKAVHLRRFMSAVEEGDIARAVGAALDASLDADLEGDFAAKLDDVLAQARLFELLTVRLELRAELQVGAKRAEIMQQAARLYSGPLANPERAVEAWLQTLVADPTNAWARSALRDHFATAHDPEPYVEALIRIGQMPPEPQSGEPVHSLQELATFAEEKIFEFSLARWAQRKLVATGTEAPESEQLAHKAQLEDEALAAARQALEQSQALESDEPRARIEALRKLAALYRGRPDDSGAALDVLAELAEAQPADRASAVCLERLASRAGSYELLERVLRVRLGAQLPRAEAGRTRLLLAALLRRRGDDAGALSEIAPLVGDRTAHHPPLEGSAAREAHVLVPTVASTALILAARAGHPQVRADALVHLAASAWPSLRSVLLATAAELYAAAGLEELARHSIEQAIESDSTCSRAIAARAAIAVSGQDQAGFGAEGALVATRSPIVKLGVIEAAISTLFPTGVLCEGLARALESAGEIQSSLAWTQRLLALRPGSPEVVSSFIRRAVQARDAARLADAIGWVLAQPKPLGELAPSFVDALRMLFDLDRARAAPIMRRTLDVFGPRSQLLRSLLIELAEALNDSALIITVLERWLASEPSREEAPDILLELANRRIALGDYDGAARETARAAERGADPHRLLHGLDEIEAHLRQGTSALGSDGLVALGEAKVRTLHALGPASQSDEAAAWRELGSLRWDLVGDRKGADDALYHASELSGERGIERYARDLCALAGVETAIDTLIERSESLPAEQSRRRAALLIEAANVAHANGLPHRALLAASSAIEADPSRADAVALVEKSSHVEGGIDVLDRTYDVLAAAALGCYGRRAAHYRGARQLERRGAIDPAFRHAVASFEAVPSEGTSYILVSRLAERASDPAEAVRALERVATTGDPVARTTWLLRAAAIAGKGEEGARLRFDLLLRALNVRPEPAIVKTLGEAVAELLAIGGDADVISMRLSRAVTVALPRLDGPDGARAAVALARIAVQTLRACNLGIEAIRRAMAADGDIDEFTALEAIVPILVEDSPAPSAALLAEIQENLRRPYSSVGSALLRFASSLATALGDKPAAALLLVQALQRTPEDEVLLHQVAEAVHGTEDAALERTFAEAVPADQRATAFLELADKHEREGHLDRAVLTLKCVLDAGSIPAEERDRLVTRLRQLFHLAGKPIEVEALLLAELGRAELSAPVRLRLARSLAASLASRDENDRAVNLLLDAAAMGALDDELVVETRRLVRKMESRDGQVDALVRLADLVEDDPNRLAILRDLAPILHDLGDHVAATQCYEAIGRLDPTDVAALQALEREAHARGDNEAISMLLARRIETVDSPEGRRTLRLRRAAFLEQRMGRLDEACAQLEALLAECPDDVVAMRYLADMHERLDEPLLAAPLWRRLSDIMARTDEESDYAVRALAAYLAGGSLVHARAMLERVAPLVPRDTVLELRVELARLEGDPRALSEALDQLATASRDAAERRALLLVEAARASSSAGDEAAALERARRALRIAPASADAILEVMRLEYRARGAGTPREAQALVEMLSEIDGPLSPQQMELHTFLLAEELDVIQGGGAGMRELTKRHAEFGPLPLIALGMAERLSRSKNFDAALPLFERALSGDLHGLRRRGHVAIAAAEAAFNADQDDAATRLLDVAADEPETRALALRRKLELTAVRGGPTQARDALQELARLTTGIDRARVLLQLGRLVAASDHAQATAIFTDAASLAASERALSAQIAEELRRIRPADPDPTPSSPSAASSRRSPSAAAPSADAAVPSSRGPASSRDTFRQRNPGQGPAGRITPVPPDPLELALFDQLLAGSFAAGEQLIERYGPNLAARSADVLKIRKHQAALRPGDRDALERLYDAAILDRNPVYARAVEHVICGFNPSAVFIAPPPLASQPEAPELLKTLLFRPARSPVNDALSVIWETGRYRRELSHYGLTGVERVHPGAGTVVAEVYATAARLLGLLRVALFQRRVASPGILQTQVALLATPAVILTGDIREDTPELRYVIGAALAGVMPEHALASGLSEDAFRTLIQALVAAFGPVNQAPPTHVAVAQLSQALWQLVPPRAERRFREVFAISDSTEFERLALDSTRQAMRRAGLFASGSIVTAVHMTLAELNATLPVPLTAPDGLERACAGLPPVADLVRLATRAEYAEARWQPASSPDRRPESIRWRAGT